LQYVKTPSRELYLDHQHRTLLELLACFVNAASSRNKPTVSSRLLNLVAELTQSRRGPELDPYEPPAWHNDVPYDNGDEDGPNRDPIWVAKVDEYLALPDPPEYDDSEEDDEDQAFKDGTWKDDEDVELGDALKWKFNRLRGILHPEPGVGRETYPYDDWKAGRSTKFRQTLSGPRKDLLNHDYYQVKLENEFRDRGLQVIVKLASVELTPEKPEYSGGDWHLEVSCTPSIRIQESETNIIQGMMNERKPHPREADKSQRTSPLTKISPQTSSPQRSTTTT